MADGNILLKRTVQTQIDRNTTPTDGFLWCSKCSCIFISQLFQSTSAWIHLLFAWENKAFTLSLPSTLENFLFSCLSYTLSSPNGIRRNGPFQWLQEVRNPIFDLKEFFIKSLMVCSNESYHNWTTTLRVSLVIRRTGLRWHWLTARQPGRNHHQSQLICETSVNGVNTVFIQLISQRSGAAIGRLPVKPFLLLALKTINSFDPSFLCFVSQMYTYVGVLLVQLYLYFKKYYFENLRDILGAKKVYCLNCAIPKFEVSKIKIGDCTSSESWAIVRRTRWVLLQNQFLWRAFVYAHGFLLLCTQHYFTSYHHVIFDLAI